jgi:hypothetical protein
MIKKLGPGFRIDITERELLNEIREIITKNSGEFVLQYSNEVPEVFFSRKAFRNDYTFYDFFYTNAHVIWIEEENLLEEYAQYRNKFYLENGSFVIVCHICRNENNVIVSVVIDIYGDCPYRARIKEIAKNVLKKF